MLKEEAKGIQEHSQLALVNLAALVDNRQNMTDDNFNDAVFDIMHRLGAIHASAASIEVLAGKVKE